MHIHQEVDATFCLDHLETVKRWALQIERLYKLILINCQCFIGHFTDGDNWRNAVIGGLYNLISFCRKVYT